MIYVNIYYFQETLIIMLLIELLERERKMSKRMELAKERLSSEDEIKYSWTGKLDGKDGYLMLSNKKLVFVHESGFLSKKYDVPLDLPYERVVKIEREGRNKLVLTEAEDRRYNFVAHVPLSRVESSIRDLIEATKKPEAP